MVFTKNTHLWLFHTIHVSFFSTWFKIYWNTFSERSNKVTYFSNHKSTQKNKLEFRKEQRLINKESWQEEQYLIFLYLCLSAYLKIHFWRVIEMLLLLNILNQNFWYIPAILIIQNVCCKKGGTFTCTCIACWCCYCCYWLIRMCDFIPSVACGYSWIKRKS